MALNENHIDIYDLLCSSMESALLQAELERGANEGYSSLIKLVREYITQLKAANEQPFFDEQEEITFFRDIWPKFYSKLFYYQLVNAFEIDCEGKSAETKSHLTTEVQQVIADFYDEHKEFLNYYRDGSDVINLQFTRRYSKSCLYDPLSDLLDKEWATIAGYRAAWALAYSEFGTYLNCQNETGSEVWECKENLTAVATTIKALVHKGSIYINGKPATVSRLKAAVEKLFGIDLSNFHKLIYMTDIHKNDQAPFLTDLHNSFVESRK